MEELKAVNDKDAAAVLEELIAYRQSGQLEEPSSGAQVAKFASIITWVVGCVLIGSSYFLDQSSWIVQPENRQFFYLLLIVSLLVTAILLYVQDSHEGVSKFFKDPVGNALRWSVEGIGDELAFFKQLDTYPLESIIQAKNYLGRKKSISEWLANMLVGSLTKVGLMPAIFATGVVMIKLGEAPGISAVEYLAMFLIVIYFACFRVAEISAKYAEYEALLEGFVSSKEKLLAGRPWRES